MREIKTMLSLLRGNIWNTWIKYLDTSNLFIRKSDISIRQHVYLWRYVYLCGLILSNFVHSKEEKERYASNERNEKAGEKGCPFLPWHSYQKFKLNLWKSCETWVRSTFSIQLHIYIHQFRPRFVFHKCWIPYFYTIYSGNWRFCHDEKNNSRTFNIYRILSKKKNLVHFKGKLWNRICIMQGN